MGEGGCRDGGEGMEREMVQREMGDLLRKICLPSGGECLGGGWWMRLRCHHTLQVKRNGNIEQWPEETETQVATLDTCRIWWLGVLPERTYLELV